MTDLAFCLNVVLTGDLGSLFVDGELILLVGSLIGVVVSIIIGFVVDAYFCLAYYYVVEDDKVIAIEHLKDEDRINFLHCSWQEAVNKAKAENKLIFIDFYTQWCGPCLNMAQQVFSLPTVGYFYNNTFVNLKIDAENGEGVALAKKYGVRLFPTYAFIDPQTEELVHYSSSRQTPEQFIQTGKCALNPKTRSPYLIEEYKKGNREHAFLIDYINYQHTIYARQNVQTAFNELIAGGAKLTDPDVWEVFVNTISGFTPYLKQVSDNYADFCQRFGKKAVDAKLTKETTYGDLTEIKALCDFEGKAFNCRLIEINGLIQVPYTSPG